VGDAAGFEDVQKKAEVDEVEAHGERIVVWLPVRFS
jgi:hypothetical protein